MMTFSERPAQTLPWLCLALALWRGAADARSLKWARTGDALTLDPHAQNEGPTHNLLHQIYEPLLIRDATGKLLPTLGHVVEGHEPTRRSGSSSCARASSSTTATPSTPTTSCSRSTARGSRPPT